MEKEKEKEEKSLPSNQKRDRIKKLHSTNIAKHDCARHYHPYFAKVKKEYKDNEQTIQGHLSRI